MVASLHIFVLILWRHGTHLRKVGSTTKKNEDKKVDPTFELGLSTWFETQQRNFFKFLFKLYCNLNAAKDKWRDPCPPQKIMKSGLPHLCPHSTFLFSLCGGMGAISE